MNIIKVDGCKNCPFCGIAEDYYYGASENYCTASEHKDIPLNEDDELVGSPEWCPLKTGDICVSLNNYKKTD